MQGVKNSPDIYWLQDQKILALSPQQGNDLFRAACVSKRRSSKTEDN